MPVYADIQTLEDFRTRFAGKRLVMVGGEYDEKQARRLTAGLQVVFERDNWVTGAPNQIMRRLRSQVGKGDLILCFIKASGHEYFYEARMVAKEKGLPCVVTTSLNPELVAQQFLKYAQPVTTPVLQKPRRCRRPSHHYRQGRRTRGATIPRGGS